jgi:CheY-like chemotaxis protein
LPAHVLEEGSQDWMGSHGVGLRGMSERLRQMGGTLHISSNESGTEILATMPIQDATVPSTVSSWRWEESFSASFKRAKMNARILIVDDHEIVRMGIRSHLLKSRPDWEVCGEAADGEQAIDLTRTLKPNLIILDITMPRLSGLEAAARMRGLGINTPVLIFTTHDFATLGTDVRDAGAQGYVLKSQAVRDLVRAIDVILEGGTFFGGPQKAETKKNDKPNPGAVFFQDFAFALWLRGKRWSKDFASVRLTLFGTNAVGLNLELLSDLGFSPLVRAM